VPAGIAGPKTRQELGGRRAHSRHTEIRDFHLKLGRTFLQEEDVFGPHVAVHAAEPVRGIETLRRLAGNLDYFRHR
jgi:hypothetical protein